MYELRFPREETERLREVREVAQGHTVSLNAAVGIEIQAVWLQRPCCLSLCLGWPTCRFLPKPSSVSGPAEPLESPSELALSPERPRAQNSGARLPDFKPEPRASMGTS